MIVLQVAYGGHRIVDVNDPKKIKEYMLASYRITKEVSSLTLLENFDKFFPNFVLLNATERTTFKTHNAIQIFGKDFEQFLVRLKPYQHMHLLVSYMVVSSDSRCSIKLYEFKDCEYEKELNTYIRKKTIDNLLNNL